MLFLRSLLLVTANLVTINTKLRGRGVGMGTRLAVLLDVLDELGDAKEVVHALEGQALCLGDEEPDEEEHGVAEAGVDDEGTVTAVSTTQGTSDGQGCRRSEQAEESSDTYP